ncbi:rhodanese-like domain-containing protein [Acetobacteraceae bacterium ESL0709]|nr:rhodanese-like domain-containing protein [Acetobacteraceae bacterium ESL0697]MDF7677503.1 rhodanese-like domain-containing protein [Acetobacteraceae bacterium ESL0709]
MKDLSAKEAWDFLDACSDALLIDVRTPSEWASVGFPDLSSLKRRALGLTWVADQEADFGHKLVEAVPDKARPVVFMCRSGQRSTHAATAAELLGYLNVFNVVDGFEDRHGPGTGWRASGLPFILLPLPEAKADA